MAAGTWNFKIEQGVTFGPKTLTWTDANGDAVDITGYTIDLEGMITKTKSVKKIDLAVGSGFTLTTPTSGIFTMEIPFATTTAYDFFKIVYNLVMTNAAGTTKTRLLGGEITLSRSSS